MTKYVLITGRLDMLTGINEVRQSVDIKWFEFLKRIGATPILYPIGVEVDNYLRDMSIDGILLTGGNDLSSLSSCKLSAIRDEAELSLIRYAINANIPLLGVCRGTQLIADFFGSSFEKKKGHVATTHCLRHNASSKYYHFLKNIDVVNSYHNFVIEDLADPLRAISFTESGDIEAFEHIARPILGVMWHPERRNSFDDNELNLFKSFLVGGIHHESNNISSRPRH